MTAEGAISNGMVDQAISEVTINEEALKVFPEKHSGVKSYKSQSGDRKSNGCRIQLRDADVAVELAAFTQPDYDSAATAQVAQANAMSQNVARLLSAQ